MANTYKVRDRDKLYLKEDRKHEPKEYFKFIGSKISEHMDRFDSPRILDIGCATGDFLYYLSSLYPSATLTGLDVMPELLTRARGEVSNCQFLEANICQRTSLPDEKFDVVFMNGTHSIFNEIHPWLENVLSLVPWH